MTGLRHLRLAALALLFGTCAAGAQPFATSPSQPTPIDRVSGLITGALPGPAGPATYYFGVSLLPGELKARLRLAAAAGPAPRVALELFDGAAGSTIVGRMQSGAGSGEEARQIFPIESTGPHVIQLDLDGGAAGSFCLVLSGTALPDAIGSACPGGLAVRAPPHAATGVAAAPPHPGGAAAAPPPPAGAVAPIPAAAPAAAAAPHGVEVITSACEERLRVGSDLLFDFDRADLRPEAAAALDEVAQRIFAAHRSAIIEGHSDGVGAERYNQDLSERRAAAVRQALEARGLAESLLVIRGFGKSRPIAPNAQPNGADDPAGRQKNRRVDVVIDTCRGP